MRFPAEQRSGAGLCSPRGDTILTLAQRGRSGSAYLGFPV